MTLQPIVRNRFSIALLLTIVLFFTIALFASSLARAQAEPPFIEKGLPGSAFAGVVPAPNGRLYGLTYSGGTFDKGTLYSVDSALSSVVIHHHFNGANGAVPYDELTYDAASAKFYGTTSGGGGGNLGTIFSFDPATSTLVTLKSDFDVNNYHPQGPLVVSGGYLFGSLAYSQGAVFRMAIDGSGFTIIHNFDPVEFGSLPQALTLGQDGKLYGVALYNGILCNPLSNLRCGTVFRLKPVLPGDTDEQFETLYQIQDRFDAGPQRRVIYGSDGLLYFNNHVRIFRLNPHDPNPASTVQMIWQETGGSVSMSIIEGADNRLYAANYGSGSVRAGRVFSINKDGSGAISLRTFSFTVGSQAYGPYGMLYRNPSGIIYGTTEYTNLASPFYGTVFAIDPGTSNVPPTLSNVAVTSPVSENGTATLSGNISDPNAGDTFTLTLNWGDGSLPQVVNYAAGTTSFSVTHQYLDDNPTATTSDSYTINLTLADNNAGSDTDSAVVTVNNAPPVLSNIIATPSTLIVGGTVNLFGNVNDVGSLDTHQVVINWNDGSPNTTLNLAAGVNFFSADHQYNTVGTFNVAVTATDDDTGSTTGGTTITVNPPNDPPTLSNVAVTSPVIESGMATLSGNIADPNAGNTFTLTVNWGDGSQPQIINYAAGTNAFSVTHQYLDDNPTATSSDNYQINLMLSDNNGGSDTDSAVVTVNNAAPTLANIAVNPSTIPVGGATTLSGNLNDAGALDTHQVVINWGDGSPATTLNLAAGVNFFNPSHHYNAVGTFNIGITATDDDTGSTSGGASVTVDPLVNTPPLLSNVQVTSPVNENGTATLTGNITDPNVGDKFALTVDWGDGTAPQVFKYPAGTTSFSVTHQYLDDNPTATTSDNYTINLLLEDNSGGSDTDSAVVRVNNLAPVLSGIAVNPATITVGGTTVLNGNVNDVGSVDTHEIVINWNDGSPNTTLNLAAGVTAFNTNHQYNAAGTFNIVVTASDDDKGSTTGAATVTVNSTTEQEKIVFASSRDGNYEIYVMNADGTSPARLTNNSKDDVDPSFSSDGSKIVFTSYRDGNAEIYVMNADGSNQTRLTNNSAFDTQPAFSPDGSRIVFISVRDGNQEIYVMNADGSNPIRLTNHPAIEDHPSFSPDGSRIAFESNRNGNNYEIFVMNANGSNQTRLTNNSADDLTPSFSPDGSRIAFTSARDGNYEIYVMNADGTNPTRLTNNPASDYIPSISPDGSQIAFTSTRDGNNEIYVMNADGTNPTRLTNHPRVDFNPSFRTPELQKIVYASNRDGNYEIYVMNADGTNQTRLTNNPAEDGQPVFSPDGSRIAFTSFRDGNYEVYLMNADGSNQTRLTNNSGSDSDPTFSPDGNRIAFVSTRNGISYEIFVMNANGSNLINLTNNAAFDADPSFSPDGSKITFVSQRDNNLEIYVMNANGSNPTRLTNNLAFERLPAFSADGSKISFYSFRDGDAEIYVMDANGANQTNLTNNPGADYASSFSADGSRITFYSNRDGNDEIYVMNADGTNPTRLTTNSASDVLPTFRPAAIRSSAPEKIVFTSARDGNAEIYTMNADGSNQTRLTNNAADDTEPTFSPDNSKIVFASTRDGNAEIYTMNADGSNPTRLTNDPGDDADPSFSPDGSRIVFVSRRNGNAEIYVMNADGTNPTRLTNNSEDDFDPSFSPDGSRIVFASNRNGNYDLYVMNANGANPTRLTNNQGVEDTPSFSPDGSRILFIHYQNVNNIDLYVMNADGSNQTRLTNNPGWDVEPAFSPDGSRIAFISDRDGNFEIYVMNADGTNPTRLTNNPAFEFFPSWSR